MEVQIAVPQLSMRKPQSPLDWIRLYRLYLAAFPAAERKPFSVIFRMYRACRSDVWCICRGNRSLGLATTVNGGDLVLLDYYAVDSRFRGQGIGSAALEMLQQRYAHCGLFVEIESTREAAPNPSERLRRREFYLRSGMAPLGVWAEVFGVKMELLGSRCQLDFEGYRSFYREHYSPWAAKHIMEDENCGKRTDA